MDARKTQDAEGSGGTGAAGSLQGQIRLSPWGSAGTPLVLSSPQFPPAQLSFSNRW